MSHEEIQQALDSKFPLSRWPNQRQLIYAQDHDAAVYRAFFPCNSIFKCCPNFASTARIFIGSIHSNNLLIVCCFTEFATAETKQITDILMFPIQEIARTGIVW